MSSDLIGAFRAVVNMTAEEIEAWLETEESRQVGFLRPDESESVGRQSGRRIVAILRRPEPLAEDHAHMRKVIGVVRRHRAQRPRRPERSRWRFALMNWGHDPLKDDLPLGD